jgi:hypothetical protein
VLRGDAVRSCGGHAVRSSGPAKSGARALHDVQSRNMTWRPSMPFHHSARASLATIHAHRPEPNEPPVPPAPNEPDTVPDPTREPPMPDTPPIGDPPPTPNQQPHAV